MPLQPEPQNRPRVYIAGPYSGGDVAVNVRKAMQTWNRLWELGFSPLAPHLTHFLHMNHPRPYPDWLEYDREWLVTVDAVFRMPGESKGADAEVALAKQHGIPVFTSVRKLREHFGMLSPQTATPVRRGAAPAGLGL